MGVLEVDKRVNRAEAIVENIGTKNVKKLIRIQGGDSQSTIKPKKHRYKENILRYVILLKVKDK